MPRPRTNVLRPLAAPVCVVLVTACSRMYPEPSYPPPVPDGPLYMPFPEGEATFDESEPGGDATRASVPGASTAAQPGGSSFDGALPAKLATVLERNQVCREKVCTLGALLPDPKFAKTPHEAKDSKAALWSHEIAGGSVIVVPRHQHVDLFAVVIDGAAVASGDEGGAVKQLGAWDALHVPGAGCTLRGAEGSGAKVVMALVTGHDTLEQSLALAKAKPWEVRWRKRPGALEAKSLSSAKDLAWGGGRFHARIAFGGDGARPLRGSLELLMMSHDAAIPEHDHPTWEHIAIVQGGGSFKLGSTEHAVRPGSIFSIPTGVKHAFRASGSDAVIGIQLYTPSGPEQRFVQLATGEKPKPEPVAPAPANPAPSAQPKPK
jgi:mannose-6-phosphate isomerase-like protein (cupin superfamily)